MEDNAVPHFTRRQLAFRFTRCFVSGLVLAFTFPPYNVTYLLPFGLAGFLASLENLTPRHAAYLGFAFGVTLYSATLFWLTNLFGMASVSLIAILASFTLIFGLIYQWLRRRLPVIPVWLLAAILWTGIEYYRSEHFVLSFGWMGLGYGAVGSAPNAHLASFFGSYGVTFLIVALSAAAVTCRNWKLAACQAALWSIAWAIPPPQHLPAKSITVRMVQAMSDDEDDLFALSKPTPEHVDVILWPEYSLNSDPTFDPKLWSRLQDVARSNHAYFIFGAKSAIDIRNDAKYHNTGFVLDTTGRLLIRHFKNHTVHFVKDGVPGTQARAVKTSIGKLGVAICYDMDYPDVARRLAQDGAEVFLVPSMDPAEWGPVQREQHRLMFRMRAIECGRWLARADVAGGTSLVGPSGVETARVKTTKPAALIGNVGMEAAQTLYVRGGWTLGPVCLVLTVALVIAGIAIGGTTKGSDPG